MAAKLKKIPDSVQPLHDWRTSDQDELERRRLRARLESFVITNQESNQEEPFDIFSNFRVKSASGMVYSVEIRQLQQRSFACDCVDFRINGMGTCKHVEAVLLYLEARYKKRYADASQTLSPRLDIVADRTLDKLRIEVPPAKLPAGLREWFDKDGILIGDAAEAALDYLGQAGLSNVRVSQEVAEWLEMRRRAQERTGLRREYERKVQSGEWPAQETLVPLFPYQREGMLHLAFTERAMLADEMGLGKTIQAIAAAALLHRLGKVNHVLVVTPASLKTEWEEQIQRFTPLPYQLVFGMREKRLQAYTQAPFFTIVNYEQMLADSLDVNRLLKPDLVILDEAQRIKNWNTKTAQAVKRLQSRYAFVLTGTPIENRIDELHSIVDFLDPKIFGPLFRFNREFYLFNEHGRPSGFKNLDQLHTRVKGCMLRRRKADVETELPSRTDRTFFVRMSDEQINRYAEHETVVSRLMRAAKTRPLSKEEFDKLMRHLAMMRMICDTNFILDPEQRECPKLAELEKILEECLADADTKIIIFSEWERMLQLVREICRKQKIGFAWHTGSVPQRRRRAEIQLFKTDPACRLFLSTESGGTGLNLQNASVVINCDLPWNPAKLEQRIARVWRKNQTRPVTVVNLVSEKTIEHNMIGTLANKLALSDGVLDLKGDLSKITLTGGRQAFLERLQSLLGPDQIKAREKAAPKKLPVDRSLGFAQEAAKLLGNALARCEERFPAEGAHSLLVVVVERDAQLWNVKLEPLHAEYFGPGQSDPLAPVRLEVIDRATDEALKRLIEAGILQPAARATRPLHPLGMPDTPAPLTEEEKRQATACRELAARKGKMAEVLSIAGFVDEAQSALREALLALAKGKSLEQRQAEPKDLAEALRPPAALWLGERAPVFRNYLADPATALCPALSALQELLR